MKRSELKRRTPLKPGKALKRTGFPRAGKPAVVNRKRIVPVRPETVSRNRAYAALTAVWLGPRGSRPCQGAGLDGWPPAARGGCSGAATEVHHGMGRGRYQMLNVGTWVALCRGCHQWATDHPADAKRVGLSWPRNGEEPTMAGKLQSKCSSCKAPIYWVWTGEAMMPLIADPVTRDPKAFGPPWTSRKGRVQETMREANLLGELERVSVHVLAEDVDPDPEKPVWRSHFWDCPDAKKFRR